MKLKHSHMKSLIAFLLGMLCTAYLFPPTPQATISDMDKREIAYEVIEWMDKADWESLQARRDIIENKRGWLW